MQFPGLPRYCVLLLVILSGVLLLGNPSNFTHPDPTGGFWPNHEGPKGGIARMYEGGIIVPILIGAFLTVLTFVIERF